LRRKKKKSNCRGGRHGGRPTERYVPTQEPPLRRKSTTGFIRRGKETRFKKKISEWSREKRYVADSPRDHGKIDWGKLLGEQGNARRRIPAAKRMSTPACLPEGAQCASPCKYKKEKKKRQRGAKKKSVTVSGQVRDSKKKKKIQGMGNGALGEHWGSRGPVWKRRNTTCVK